MVFGKGALAAQAGRHRRLQQLRQFPQGPPGLGVVDPLTGVDDRSFGLEQHLGCPRDRWSVGTVSDSWRRLVGEWLRDILRQQVGGELHQDRTRAAVSDLGESAAQRCRQVSRERDLLAGLGHLAVVEGGVEVGLHLGPFPGMAHRQDQDRGRFGVGLGHAAEGVFGARSVLHAEDADPFPAVHPAEGIGHVQAGSLLAHDDGANSGLGRRFDEEVQGVGEKDIHSLQLQNAGHCIGNGHGNTV